MLYDLVSSVFITVIGPSVNTEAIHVPSTSCNKLSASKMTLSSPTVQINIGESKPTYESSVNTEVNQDPSTPCKTIASYNLPFEPNHHKQIIRTHQSSNQLSEFNHKGLRQILDHSQLRLLMHDG